MAVYARVVVSLFILTLILAATAVCRADDTVTVITYSHKYENVTYRIDQKNHQLVLALDDKTVLDPDEIRFIFDQSGNDITQRIRLAISPQKSKNEQQVEKDVQKAKYVKSQSNTSLLRNVKVGLAIGYLHSFSDYFNKKNGGNNHEPISYGFGDGINYNFWFEHKISDFGIRISYGYAKFKHKAVLDYSPQIKFTNELSYCPLRGTLVLYPDIHVSRLSTFLGVGIGVYQIKTKERLSVTGQYPNVADATGETSKFGVHFLLGCEPRLTKCLGLVFEADYCYINGTYTLEWSSRRQNGDSYHTKRTLDKFDYGGMNIRTAIIIYGY
jgi:hypothetical protein